MTIQIDTIKGDVTALLKGCESDGRYAVPLARAICRNSHCETLMHNNTPRFHYFTLQDGEPVVRFNLHRAEQKPEMLDSLVSISQSWFSAEITRLANLQRDLDTLKAVES